VIRVLVAERESAARDDVLSALALDGETRVVAEAMDASSTIQLARELHPDLVLLDGATSSAAGLDVAATLSVELPDTGVFVLPKDEPLRAVRSAVSTTAARQRFAWVPADWRRGMELLLERGVIAEGQVDSALAELTQALEEMRTEDAKDLVYVYESKALMEQSIAMAQLRLGNTQAAREAFGRALQEDMAYFPAHMQLGYLALESKDTATAVSEMDLAVQIRGDDPGLRYTYGFILGMIGKHKEAEEQLRKAAELNPVYAAPHYGLGKVLDAQQRSADALQEYRTFLALASRSDLRRADVEARVKVLASNGGN
jgi:Flp pilus assembly protein TadD